MIRSKDEARDGRGGFLLTRRQLLAAAFALTLTPASSPPRKSVPLIHCTDLFRPHMDPDDHFDLACAYALAATGHVRLLGVVCDAVPEGHPAVPDAAAIEMLNHLTGLSVPFVVGAKSSDSGRAASSSGQLTDDAVAWILTTLKRSREKVAIMVTGSCKHVAEALRGETAVFARKCAAIYLNAGSGAPHPHPTDELEYNVALDPASYITILQAPCPVYWLPCFERVSRSLAETFHVRPHGSYYRFRMGDVFEHIPPALLRFFLFMLEKAPGDQWRQWLYEPRERQLLEKWSGQDRNMWCTAAFLHLRGPIPATAPFRFEPVRVTCTPDGRTSWTPGRSRPLRLKLTVTDTARYEAYMTGELRTLLGVLGRKD